MSSFSARLRLPGQSRIPLGVEVDVSDELITLSAGDRQVARWSLDKVDISYLSDGFHIKVDDEEVVLSVTEEGRFASELGVTASRPAPTQVAAAPRSAHDVATRTSGPGSDLRRRIAQISVDLRSETVAPEAAFAEWLGLLKELNARHARGTMPTPLFHELNTLLLGLIPGHEPAIAP